MSKICNLKASFFVGFIFVYALFVTGSTYAFMNFTSSDSSASGTGGCFQVSYSGQNVNLGTISSSDSQNPDAAATTITLSKDSSCKIYTEANIYLHINDSTTAPIDTFPYALMYRLNMGEYQISDDTITSKGTILLATVPLTEESVTYTFSMIVDSNYSAGRYHGTSFSGYVYAEAAQTSTIDQTYFVTFEQSHYPDLDFYKSVKVGQPYGWLPLSNSVCWHGKNLFNSSIVDYGQGIYVTGDGNEVSDTNYYVYSLGVDPGTTYTITNSGSYSTQGYAFYDSADNFISGQNYSSRSTITFTTPANVSYMKFSVLQDDLNSFQIEKGSAATAYQPFCVTENTIVTDAKDHSLTAIYNNGHGAS